VNVPADVTLQYLSSSSMSHLFFFVLDHILIMQSNAEYRGGEIPYNAERLITITWFRSRTWGSDSL